MVSADEEKKELEATLATVKKRMMILDMVEDRLTMMRTLASRANDIPVDDHNRITIQKKIVDIKNEIILLESQAIEVD